MVEQQRWLSNTEIQEAITITNDMLIGAALYSLRHQALLEHLKNLMRIQQARADLVGYGIA
jgi:ribosomal protein L29